MRKECVDAGHRQVRRRRPSGFVDELRQDVIFGARQLRRNPGFNIVAVLQGLEEDAALLELPRFRGRFVVGVIIRLRGSGLPSSPKETQPQGPVGIA